MKTYMPDSDDVGRVAVVLCSVGRPEALAVLVERLQRQTLVPTRIVIVVTKPEDAPQAGSKNAPFETIISPKGLPVQRNRGLDAVLGDCDIVAFFDDDYVPSCLALEGMTAAFKALSNVNGMTGVLLADGIRGEGISLDEAMTQVDNWDEKRKALRNEEWRPTVVRSRLAGLYGCNMAYRTSAIGDQRFDERLPLYAWQEDIDFAARIPGERIKTDAFVGVHCGLKSGRETAGERLGYSQIANPLYLWRKGTMSTKFAACSCMRNLLANHAKIFRPEPWIDRRSRARGNRRAVAHALLGRFEPEHILKL